MPIITEDKYVDINFSTFFSQKNPLEQCYASNINIDYCLIDTHM